MNSCLLHLSFDVPFLNFFYSFPGCSHWNYSKFYRRYIFGKIWINRSNSCKSWSKFMRSGWWMKQNWKWGGEFICTWCFISFTGLMIFSISWITSIFRMPSDFSGHLVPNEIFRAGKPSIFLFVHSSVCFGMSCGQPWEYLKLLLGGTQSFLQGETLEAIANRWSWRAIRWQNCTNTFYGLISSSAPCALMVFMLQDLWMKKGICI